MKRGDFHADYAFVFPFLSLSRSASASFNCCASVDTFSSSSSIVPRVMAGLYGVKKLRENPFKASTPQTYKNTSVNQRKLQRNFKT